MTREISDLQKKRAYNLIWNAAADYGFLPDFKFYTRDGIADVYWNSLIGLARKHYDYPQLSKLFRGLEHEEEAGEYEALLWLGLENALVAKEKAARPALVLLQRRYAESYLKEFGGDHTEDDRFFDFLAAAHYRRLLGLPQKVSRYDLTLLDHSEDKDGAVLEKYSSKPLDPIEIDDSYWESISQGMRRVCTSRYGFTSISRVSEDGSKERITAAGKTGTAQQGFNTPNHALFLGYAPFDDPEIAIAVRIPNGYSSSYAALTAAQVMQYYFDPDSLSGILSSEDIPVYENGD